MAITIVSQPDKVHPAYNPVVYFIDSTNKNNPSFRYIVQIFDSGSATPYREVKLAPRPNDKLGYIDISKLVQDKVGSQPPPLSSSLLTWYSANNKVYNYDVRFGEEYVGGWNYSDYQFATAGWTSLTNFSFDAHPYQVGDQVFVQMSSTYNDCRDAINGYFTVIDVPNAYTITINLQFPCSNAVSPGVVTYADNRKTRVTNLASSVDNVGFDGAYSPAAWLQYSGSDLTGSLNTTILTDSPASQFEIKPFQDLVWSFYDGKSGDQAAVYFVTDQGDVYRTITTGSTSFIKMVGVGANADVTALSGTLPMIKSSTKYYDVFSSSTVCDSASFAGTCLANPKTTPRRVYVSHRCPINTTQLMFLDRLGSYNSFAMSLHKQDQGVIEREQYRKHVGTGPTGTSYTYNTYDPAITTFAVKLNKRYVLSTDWLTDDNSVYFEQLLTSPEVYVNQLEPGDDNWYSCIILDSNFTTPRTANRKLIRRTVTIQLSLNAGVNI